MAKTGGRLTSQVLYIDAATAITFHSTSLAYPGQLGQFYESNGKMYQLVLLDSSSIAATAGDACSWIDYDDFVVTTDISDTIPNAPAGVIPGTVAVSEYFFMQVRGPHATVHTDGGDDIAAGDHVYVDPTTDGVVDSTAAGTASIYVPLGVATAADVDADNTVAIQITVPLNM